MPRHPEDRLLDFIVANAEAIANRDPLLTEEVLMQVRNYASAILEEEDAEQACLEYEADPGA